ncbi:MAG: PEP-CTERM sorting domain-containing protein, partial [Candidatus Omnitrophica bacterium]|nr:PEP-CTERM sorting domain-containing protein [Candidatus Omnitrophota bacterium]
ATECIPEPITMIMLGSLATGLFGAAGIRRRKRG